MASLAEPIASAGPRVTLAGQVGYGVGQIAGQVFRDLPSLLLLFFMTTVLGVAPALAGAAIFIPKLVLGIGCDFAVGVLSDRWRRKVARRWWLVAGAIGAPLAMTALFHVPALSPGAKVAYVSAVFSGYMIVFASFSVPYLAIAGELTAAPGQRSVLMAWRLVFTAVGVLVQGALAPAIVQAAGGGQHGYEAMSLALAAICPAALIVAFLSTGRLAAGREVAPEAPRVRLSAREAFAVLARPRFSVLLLANLLQLAGAGMGYASLLYFLRYNTGRADAFQVIGGIVFAACAGIVVAQPLWIRLGATLGKKRAYLLGTAIYAATYAVWAFAAGRGTTAAYALSFVAAVGNSGWTMLGFSMMSDVSGDDARHAGLYSAAWIATDKVAFALGGTLLVGLLLSGFGFDSARAVAGLPQTPLALVGIMIAFGLAPAALNLAGGLVFWRWGAAGVTVPFAELLRPTFIVADMAAAIEFYTQVFEWRVVFDQVIKVDRRFPPAAPDQARCRLVVFQVADPELGTIGFMRYLDDPIPAGPPKTREKLGQGEAILVIRSAAIDECHERMQATRAIVHAPPTDWEVVGERPGQVIKLRTMSGFDPNGIYFEVNWRDPESAWPSPDR